MGRFLVLYLYIDYIFFIATLALRKSDDKRWTYRKFRESRGQTPVLNKYLPSSANPSIYSTKSALSPFKYGFFMSLIFPMNLFQSRCNLFALPGHIASKSKWIWKGIMNAADFQGTSWRKETYIGFKEIGRIILFYSLNWTTCINTENAKTTLL